MTTTTNMGLDLPSVNADNSLWGGYLNTSLSTIDVHDHSTGKGVKVPSAGININADLAFNNFNASGLLSIGLNDPAADASVVRSVYVKSGDLYYKNGSGTVVQLTAGGSIVGTSGSITGMGAGDSVLWTHATGLVSFNSLSGSGNAVLQAAEYQAGTKFTFGLAGTPNLAFVSSQFQFNNGSTGNGVLLFSQWNPNTTHSLTLTSASHTFNFNNAGTGDSNALLTLLKLKDASSANTATLGVASGVSSSYSLTLPNALPAGTAFLTVDTSGNVAFSPAIANGLTRSYLAITSPSLSSSSGSFTTTSTSYVTALTVSNYVTTGHPVDLRVVPDGSAVAAIRDQSGVGVAALFRGATKLGEWNLNGVSNPMGPGLINYIDTPAAGTYTYTLQIKSTTGGTQVTNCKLSVYEMA